MRVLLISHTYVARVNQPKLHELAALPGVELRVVVPQVWNEGLHGDLPADTPAGDARFEFLPIPTLSLGRGSRYVHRSLDLTMRRFQPDLIFVEEGWRGLTIFQAALYKRLWARRAKLVFFTWENIFQPLPRWQSVIARFNLRHINGGICGNEDGIAVARAGGYRGPLEVVPQLGIDTQVFFPSPNPALRQKLGLGDAFVIGFAARMVPEKGAVLLVEAAARATLPDGWKLLLIGDGTDRARAEARATELGIADHLVMAGVVPHLELAGYYNVMDVLVSPSVATATWKEQFGLCVAQAMSCGVPVIGSTCGETPNLIGDAGLIFEQGDAAALTAQLERIASEADLRADLRARGMARMHEHYSFAGIARRTHCVWGNLLDG